MGYGNVTPQQDVCTTSTMTHVAAQMSRMLHYMCCLNMTVSVEKSTVYITGMPKCFLLSGVRRRQSVSHVHVHVHVNTYIMYDLLRAWATTKKNNVRGCFRASCSPSRAGLRCSRLAQRVYIIYLLLFFHFKNRK